MDEGWEEGHREERRKGEFVWVGVFGGAEGLTGRSAYWRTARPCTAS